MLNQAQLKDYREQGFLILKSNYDVETEIRLTQEAIHRLIGLLAELITKNHLPREYWGKLRAGGICTLWRKPGKR